MEPEENQKGLHPFDVFPEDVWPDIAEKLEDSSEILKLMEVIPEISGVIHNRRKLWIFDQVIPFLSFWLNRKQVLACRLVCKQWSKGVDRYLDNLPICRAYDHEKKATGQVWVFGGLPFQLTSPNFYFTIPWINSSDLITKFLKDMGKHGASRNPVVGRRLSIDLMGLDGFQMSAESVSEMFRRVGHHTWFITLWNYSSGQLDYPAFHARLVEWFSLMPNLKKLRLALPSLYDFMEGDQGDHWDSEEDLYDLSEDSDYDYVDAPPKRCRTPICKEEAEANYSELAKFAMPLPPLPNLESLEIVFEPFPIRLMASLVGSYSKQIRKLELCLPFWRPEFFDKFPNLTELTVNSIKSREGLTDMLMSIEAPLLYDLSLKKEYPCSTFVECDIFPWLTRFPKIRNLALVPDAYLNGRHGILTPTSDLIPSLKYLFVMKDYLHYNSDFLLSFPNLEFLQLEDIFQIPEGEPLEPTLKIWEYVKNGRMYESNVWELLPKLKAIQMVFDGPGVGPNLRFRREKYEYLKKQPAHETN